MTTFKDLGVDSEIELALNDLGFESPMPVQEQVIPLLLEGRNDLIALAQTGTGKTAAYGLPLIQQTDTDSPLPQTVIICPTRELCMQIAGDLTDFGAYVDNLKILPVYGGSSIENQIKTLRKGVQIIVATPGRLCDLIRRKAVKSSAIRTVVLDEADEMLNMGFQESIDEILSVVPKERQTLLFSATMPKEVAAIAGNYMTDPKEITVGTRNAGAENIKHVYYTVHAKDKYLALKRIVDYYPDIYGIVFCRTRKDTQEIADQLIADGYNAESLHGDLSQAQRDSVMQKFRIRHIQLLVATDVAARGLDVNDLTHIINYALPDDIQSYTHRSGRTARAGKTGISIAIINLKEKHYIRQIEKLINKPFVPARVPGGREICEKQLFSMIHKMEHVEMEHSEIDSYLPSIFRKLEWLDKEEIIKRFVALEFNRFLEYYRNAKDINVTEDTDHKKGGRTGKNEVGGKGNQRDGAEGKGKQFRKGRDRQDGNEVNDFSRIRINIGKSQGLYPNTLIDFINTNSPGKRIRIGEISLDRSSCTFEVDSNYKDFILKMMHESEFNGEMIDAGVAPGEANVSHYEQRKFGKEKNFREWGGKKKAGKGSKQSHPKKKS